ncbi:hypothetical protein IQ211_18060 [Xenorhabdus griffiniae]|nr:hypothetical protein [Xenorhabdus griffiniae]MBE8589204.1 hypothetical protein [Xenorhabdus griffiniae]
MNPRDVRNQAASYHFEKLLELLSSFHIQFYCTGDYAVYDCFPEEEHLTGKTFTQRIESTNLIHRTRIKRLNRKTIGYSKSEEMHDKVIDDRHFH